MNADQAHEKLRGTLSDFKNEMLFKNFGINYAKIDAIWRKGTTMIRIPYQKEPGINPKEQEKAQQGEQEEQKKIEEGGEEVAVDQEEADKAGKGDDKKKGQQKKQGEGKKGQVKAKAEKAPKFTWRTESLNDDLIQDEFWQKYKESVLLE